MLELELCPRCGKAPKVSQSFVGYQVECCGVGIPFPPADSIIESVETWNRRIFREELERQQKEGK